MINWIHMLHITFACKYVSLLDQLLVGVLVKDSVIENNLSLVIT